MKRSQVRLRLVVLEVEEHFEEDEHPSLPGMPIDADGTEVTNVKARPVVKAEPRWTWFGKAVGK